jgi:hypothetical protein
MQQKRNIQLLISLGSLSIATLLLIVFGFRDKTDTNKNLFKVTNQAEIDEVQFQSPQAKIHLKYDGAKWMVNGKEADRQLIKLFFATILQAEPKRKLPKSYTDSLAKTSSAVKISLLKNGQSLQEYFVVGNSTKSETYFYFEGGDWYTVTIPGYRVYVASIFELTESDWREKRIFNFNWQNFKTLKAHFPAASKQNFTLTFTNNIFSIEEVALADTTKLSNYLESLFNLKAERILTPNEVANYDSLYVAPPLLQIEIEDIANKKMNLKIYQIERDKPIVGRINEECVLLSPQASKFLLKQRDYFVLKQK